MKLIIKGREYPFVPIGKAPNLHMIELQAQGKKLLPEGLGMSVMRRMELEFRDFARAVEAAGGDAAAGILPDGMAPPDSVYILTSVLAFLAQRGAGEDVSLRSALMLSLDDIVQKPDEADLDAAAGEDDDAADPTTPGSGGPATPESGADEATAPAGPSS